MVGCMLVCGFYVVGDGVGIVGVDVVEVLGWCVVFVLFDDVGIVLCLLFVKFGVVVFECMFVCIGVFCVGFEMVFVLLVE